MINDKGYHELYWNLGWRDYWRVGMTFWSKCFAIQRELWRMLRSWHKNFDFYCFIAVGLIVRRDVRWLDRFLIKSLFNNNNKGDSLIRAQRILKYACWNSESICILLKNKEPGLWLFTWLLVCDIIYLHLSQLCPRVKNFASIPRTSTTLHHSSAKLLKLVLEESRRKARSGAEAKRRKSVIWNDTMHRTDPVTRNDLRVVIGKRSCGSGASTSARTFVSIRSTLVPRGSLNFGLPPTSFQAPSTGTDTG